MSKTGVPKDTLSWSRLNQIKANAAKLGFVLALAPMGIEIGIVYSLISKILQISGLKHKIKSNTTKPDFVLALAHMGLGIGIVSGFQFSLSF